MPEALNGERILFLFCLMGRLKRSCWQ
jgi:hypothetical protein